MVNALPLFLGYTAVLATLGVMVGIAGLLVLAVMGMYNGLVSLRNRYKNAFAQIDVQLKRRYDLIPNLVETAKSYMAHEKGTLEAVISARGAAMSARTQVAQQPGSAEAMKQLNDANVGLNQALGRLMITQEAYPDLKANQNMMQLTAELTATENKIAFAREAYNDAVTNFNNKREMFPTSLIAGMFTFNEATLFEVSEETERAPVKVAF
jgi:LemA protein